MLFVKKREEKNKTNQFSVLFRDFRSSSVARRFQPDENVSLSIVLRGGFTIHAYYGNKATRYAHARAYEKKKLFIIFTRDVLFAG